MKLDDFAIFSPAMIKTYLYVGLTLLIAVIADNLLRSLIKVPKHFDNRRARRIAAITRNLITIVVYIVAVYIALTLLGVNLAPLLASASIIGIILGIGARSTIEDFVTGIFFLSLDSIAIGDYVKIGDAVGYVERIGARIVEIRADDGSLHIIPNSQIRGFANYSRNKANIIIDLPIKSTMDITKTIKAADNAIELMKKDDVYKDALFAGTKVNGIENFINPEIMILRVTLVTYPVRRMEAGRKYRLLVKKEFEKSKLHLA